jgi:hypothetical protein
VQRAGHRGHPLAGCPGRIGVQCAHLGQELVVDQPPSGGVCQPLLVARRGRRADQPHPPAGAVADPRPGVAVDGACQLSQPHPAQVVGGQPALGGQPQFDNHRYAGLHFQHRGDAFAGVAHPAGRVRAVAERVDQRHKCAVHDGRHPAVGQHGGGAEVEFIHVSLTFPL